jgi:hypothetical protein
MGGAAPHITAPHQARVRTFQGRAGERVLRAGFPGDEIWPPSVPDWSDGFVATMLESPAASGRVPRLARSARLDAAPRVH